MNIISNYIVDDKDPLWMNEHIKRKIMDKEVACKSFTFNKNYDVCLKLQIISTELSEIKLKIKVDYHCQLSDTLTDPVQNHTGLFKNLFVMERKSH